MLQFALRLGWAACPEELSSTSECLVEPQSPTLIMQLQVYEQNMSTAYDLTTGTIREVTDSGPATPYRYDAGDLFEVFDIVLNGPPSNNRSSPSGGSLLLLVYIGSQFSFGGLPPDDHGFFRNLLALPLFIVNSDHYPFPNITGSRSEARDVIGYLAHRSYGPVVSSQVWVLMSTTLAIVLLVWNGAIMVYCQRKLGKRGPISLTEFPEMDSMSRLDESTLKHWWSDYRTTVSMERTLRSKWIQLEGRNSRKERLVISDIRDPEYFEYLELSSVF
jgi:hypothetical protein